MYKRNPTIRTVRRNVYVNDGGGGSDNARLFALAAARPDRVPLSRLSRKRRDL